MARLRTGGGALVVRNDERSDALEARINGVRVSPAPWLGPSLALDGWCESGKAEKRGWECLAPWQDALWRHEQGLVALLMRQRMWMTG